MKPENVARLTKQLAERRTRSEDLERKRNQKTGEEATAHEAFLKVRDTLVRPVLEEMCTRLNAEGHVSKITLQNTEPSIILYVQPASSHVGTNHELAFREVVSIASIQGDSKIGNAVGPRGVFGWQTLLKEGTPIEDYVVTVVEAMLRSP